MLLLENTRFHKGEEKNDPALRRATGRARRHLRQRRLLGRPSRACLDRRPGATSCRPMPAAPCRPNSKRCPRRWKSPQRPLGAIVGGAKVSTKLELLGNLDAAMSIFCSSAAAWPIPSSPRRARRSASRCASMICATPRARSSTNAAANKCQIVLPTDAVVATEFKAHAPSHVVSVDHVGDDEMILDVGPRSVAAGRGRARRAQDPGLERACSALSNSSLSTRRPLRSPMSRRG